jgi:hypothetical protein
MPNKAAIRTSTGLDFEYQCYNIINSLIINFCKPYYQSNHELKQYFCPASM